MLHFTLAQIRTSLGKLTLAGLAIALGTAFVSVTLIASSVFRAAAEAVVTASLAGADVIVSPASPTDDDIARLRAVGGVAAVDHQRVEGLALATGSGNYFIDFQTLPSVGAKPTLRDGRLPAADGEVAIAADVAQAMRIEVGDQVTWQSWSSDANGRFRVSGITESGLALLEQPPGWAPRETLDRIREMQGAEAADTDRVLIYGDGTVDADAMAAAIDRAFPGHHPQTAQQVIDSNVENMLGNAQFFILLGFGFAAVAICVAAMVISNTFEVLVAQRTRVLALLRCGGATKGQVGRTVLLEALLLGLAGSIAGIVVGLALGFAGMAWVSKESNGLVSLRMLHLEPGMFLIPLAVGVLVTVVSAIAPARSATRVSPVAALRPTASDPLRAGRRSRLIVGLALAVVGAVLLLTPPILVVAASFDDRSRLYDSLGWLLLSGIAGGLLLVGGFLVLSVFVVPPIVRALGAALAVVAPQRSRATIHLATANAARNPRRIAATASALVIGVGLVTMMATGAATGRASLAQTVKDDYPADVVVEAGTPSGITPAVHQAVRGTEGVRHTAEVWILPAYDDKAALVGDPAALAQALEAPDVATLRDGHVAVARQGGKEIPAEVTLSNDDGATVTLPTQEVSQLPVAMIAPKAAVAELLRDNPDMLIADIDETDVEGLVNRLTDAVVSAGGDAPAQVQVPLLERMEIDRVVNALLTVLLVLLGVAVVIALVGVANTLTLSVLERRREHGTLRSLGVTRGQLRGMLAVEGALIALGGVVIGILLGLVTGFAGATILLGTTTGFTFAIHWLVLGGTVVIAVLAGFVASVAPARTALRVPVVVALAND